MRYLKQGLKHISYRLLFLSNKLNDTHQGYQAHGR
jgi:hypothetical protein